MGAVIKTLQLQHALDYQDDIDRESIFLMGMKDTSGGGGMNN